MPPKKKSNSDSPPPASDESDFDVEEEIKQKKPKKPAAPRKEKTDKPSEKAADRSIVENDDEFDENEDLLQLEVPPPPADLASSRKDRLLIARIDVTNFKSYYGTKTIGPFHKNFTAIIGPNGSGKSNVIDSLLFVFGYRSTKIRTKKVSSLIHSSAGRICKSCTVEIFFKRIVDLDEHNYSVINDSAFSISRTAFADNTSKYAIDGKTRTYKEVEARLHDVGIDIVHNRFLILQGEVEAISMMKPKGINGDEGMLEYLEDIIGSHRYALPIRKLDKRLDKLQVDLSQQKTRKQNARDDKESLEPNVRDTVTYLNKENESIVIRSKLMQYEKQKHADRIAPLEAKCREKEVELKAVVDRQTEHAQEVKELDKDDKKLTKEKDSAHKELDQAKGVIESIENAEAKRKNNLKRCTQEVNKIETEIEKENKKKEQLLSVPEKAAKKIESLKKESEELQQQSETANRLADENLGEFEERSKKEQEKKREIEEEYGKRNTVYNEIKAKTTVAEAELSDLRKIADRDKDKLADLRKNLADLETKHEAESRELQEINDKLPGEDKELKQLQKDAPQAHESCQKVNQEVRELRARLEQDKASVNSMLRGNKLSQALMKAKADGVLPGLLGRLGDLGGIDKKYDAVISTVCGPLDYYVVETKNDGQAAIDFLTERQLPRTSFLCIDQIEKSIDKQRMAMTNFPETRLFDQLTIPDDRVRSVFYQALGDLLVVADLATAEDRFKKYKGRFRFATLNGETIETSGSVSGGGKPRYGRMGAQVAVQTDKNQGKRIEEMTRELEQKTAKADELSARVQEMDRRIFLLRTSVTRLSDKKRTLDISVQSANDRLDVLRDRIKAQEKEAAKVRVDEAELEAQQKTLDAYIKERDSAAEKVKEYKDKVDSIAGKIDAIFHELVGKHKEEGKTAHQKYQQVEKNIAKETASINNSERNIAKVDDRIAQCEKDLAKKKKEIERLEEEVGEEEALAAVKEKANAIEEKLSTFDEKFAEIRKKRSDLNEEEISLEKQNKEIGEEIACMKSDMSETQRKIFDINKKIADLKLTKVPQLAFMSNVAKPEEMQMEFEDNFDQEEWSKLTPCELEKMTKGLISEYVNRVYSMEYELRDKKANEPEPLDERDDEEAVPTIPAEELRELSNADIEELNFQLKAREQQLTSARKNINLNVIEDYVAMVKRYNVETSRTREISDNYTAHRAKALMLKRLRLEEFVNAYMCITNSVREIYQTITRGGDATLDFKNGNEPFSEGIQFLVRPPKKSWKIIENLSGGEKTLASLALVFALHHFRPTPFYVMDEIDAALDFKNVSTIGHYIKMKTTNAQFIIISLRNNMFELCDRLVGIFKVNDCTNNVAIDPLKICAQAKELGKTLHGMDYVVMPDEVRHEYVQGKQKEREDAAAMEKEYESFPSSKDLVTAEKIVAIENRLKKESKKLNEPKQTQELRSTQGSMGGRQTRNGITSGATSVATGRPESRLMTKMKMPTVRLVQPTLEELAAKRISGQANEADKEEKEKENEGEMNKRKSDSVTEDSDAEAEEDDDVVAKKKDLRSTPTHTNSRKGLRETAN